MSGSALAYRLGRRIIDVGDAANKISSPNMLSCSGRIGACLQFGGTCCCNRSVRYPIGCSVQHLFCAEGGWTYCDVIATRSDFLLTFCVVRRFVNYSAR